MPVICPVCRNGSAYEMELALCYCDFCKHLFQTDLTPTITYDRGYVENAYGSAPCKAMSHLRAGHLIGQIGYPGGKTLVDVGYGNGAFLKYLDDALGDVATSGYDVHGVDYGVWEARPGSTYDIVTAFDSIEHMPDPHRLFDFIAPIMTVSTPYRHQWCLHDPQRWKHFKPGEHLHYFSLWSLNALFTYHGYKLMYYGFPEDVLRGRLNLPDGTTCDNILTAIYRKPAA